MNNDYPTLFNVAVGMNQPVKLLKWPQELSEGHLEEEMESSESVSARRDVRDSKQYILGLASR